MNSNNRKSRTRRFATHSALSLAIVTAIACDVEDMEEMDSEGTVDSEGDLEMRSSTATFCNQYDGLPVNIRSYHDRVLRAGDAAEGWQINQTLYEGSWEQFTVDCLDDDTVAFKTHHNRYLRAKWQDHDWLVDQQTYIGTHERFTPIDVGNGQWAFKSHHDRYLRAKWQDHDWLVDQQTYIGAHEKFTIEEVDDSFCGRYDGDAITLRTNNGRLVRAGNAAEGSTFNQTYYKGSYEKLTVECDPAGEVSLKTNHDTYLSVNDNGSVTQKATIEGPKEKLTPVEVSSNHWAFRTQNFYPYLRATGEQEGWVIREKNWDDGGGGPASINASETFTVELPSTGEQTDVTDAFCDEYDDHWIYLGVGGDGDYLRAHAVECLDNAHGYPWCNDHWNAHVDVVPWKASQEKWWVNCGTNRDYVAFKNNTDGWYLTIAHENWGANQAFYTEHHHYDHFTFNYGDKQHGFKVIWDDRFGYVLNSGEYESLYMRVDGADAKPSDLSSDPVSHMITFEHAD